MTAPRGLIVSQFPVLPATQGNRMRLLSACQEFKRRGFILDFLYYPREDGSLFHSQDLDQLAAFFNIVYLVPSDDPWPHFREKYQRSQDIWSERIGEYFAFVNKRIEYDFVYANYAPYAHIFKHCAPETIRVLDTHDKLANRRDFLESQGHKPDFFSLSAQDEGQLSAKANLVVAIKEGEADYYRNVSKRPVITIGVPVELREDAACDVVAAKHSHPLTFGFIGSDNAVNRLALVGLFDIISSRASGFWRNAKLVIVGRVLDAVAIPSNLTGLVEHVRYVSDLSEFYSRCDVILVPTIHSTGLKIKSVEALGYGKPIVATADGFDGIESPFFFHKCQNQIALVDVCESIISRTILLHDLAQATISVRQSYMKSYEANVEALMRLCGRYRVCIVFCEHEAINLYHAYLFAFLKFLKRRCLISVYFEKPSDLPKAFCQLLQSNNTDVNLTQGLPGGAGRIGDLIISETACHLRWPGASAYLTISPDGICLRTSETPIGHISNNYSYGDNEHWDVRNFQSIKALDFIDQPNWGTKKRLIFLVSDGFESDAAEWLRRFALSAEFRQIRSDYVDFRVVSFSTRNALSDAATVFGFRFLSFRDHLFDDPWGAQKHLVFLGSFTDSELKCVHTLASVASTTIFAQDEKLLTVAKIINGPDVWVGEFSDQVGLVGKLAWANRECAKSSVLSRYRANRGMLLEITERLKQHFIETVVRSTNNTPLVRSGRYTAQGAGSKVDALE